MSITRIETVFSTHDIEISYLPMAIDEENTLYNFKYHIYPYSSKYKMIKYIEISDKSNNLLYDCDFTQAGIFWKSRVFSIKIIFDFDNLNPENSTAVVILENGINSDITNNYIVQNVEGNIYKFVTAPTPNIEFDQIINKRNSKFNFGGKSRRRKGKSRRRKGKSRRRKYKKH